MGRMPVDTLPCKDAHHPLVAFTSPPSALPHRICVGAHPSGSTERGIDTYPHGEGCAIASPAAASPLARERTPDTWMGVTMTWCRSLLATHNVPSRPRYHMGIAIHDMAWMGAQLVLRAACHPNPGRAILGGLLFGVASHF